MDLVNQLVEERRRIEQEDEARRVAAEAARREEAHSASANNDNNKTARQRTASSSHTQRSNSHASGAAASRGGSMIPRKPAAADARSASSARAAAAAAASQSKNSATVKQSMRQTRREQRKAEEEDAVAAASSALLHSIVPEQLLQSASDFVLAVAPRIFSFHTRHISSFRHPFFTMLCHEDPESNSANDENGGGAATATARRQGGGVASASSGGGGGGASGSASGRGKPALHRGGTAMVSAGHVSAVDNAIKARRRPWQTLGEYLVERYDDISSAYPIEVERWKQASYMLDAVLLEEDLSRRRRDILEAQHVVRALEACWTSWGGTTTAGLDFERYRAQHLRLYRTLLGLEALDPSLALLVDRSIEKDWAVDREMAVFGSGAGGRAPSRTSGGGARNRSTSPSADSASAASGARRDSSITSGLARQPSQRSLSGENKREGSKESASAADDAVNDPAAAAAAQQVEYEVPFRRFCISMLELADNWTRARVGDVFSQIFAKFLMKVVWCEPSRDKTPMVGAGAAVPASFAHIQNVEREKQRWQKQFEQQVQQRSGEENNNNGGTGGPSSIALSKDPEGVRDGTRPNSAATGGQQTHGFGDGGGGAGSNSDFDASSSQHSNNPATDEWSRICEGLRRRAFMHRGGPVVRCIPPEAPGMPVQYVALPGTRASAEEENRRK